MLANLLLATAFQILPFYEQKPDENYYALRPLCSTEGDVTDVAWPVFTCHRDWWRFCYVVNYQNYAETKNGYQFSIVPFWFNGRDKDGSFYWGLFPFYGEHPHIAMMDDFRFTLWPLYHRYRRPRNLRTEWLETQSVLFPFVSWRSDGAWSFWPLYGVNYQRESDHRYILWPFITWADYREDRDTAGEGSSLMIFPLYARVNRARESQHSFLPPFFSFATTPQSRKIRCPWPLVEWEDSPSRNHLSVWPFYERSENRDYHKGASSSCVTRFGWKLVELYDDETRVFPFFASGRDHTRVWPFWESETKDGETYNRVLALFPIRWVPAIDRNWAKFWTFYENRENEHATNHSLFWGLIKWQTTK